MKKSSHFSLNRKGKSSQNYQGRYCTACENPVSEDKVADNIFCPTPSCQTEFRKVNKPAYFLKRQ